MTRHTHCFVASLGPSLGSGGSGRFLAALPSTQFKSEGAGMELGLRDLNALSLLAAFCCGLALAHDDLFFAAVFGVLRPTRERPRSGRAAEQRDELASSQLVELHSVPASQGRIAGYRIGEEQSGGISRRGMPSPHLLGRVDGF